MKEIDFSTSLLKLFLIDSINLLVFLKCGLAFSWLENYFILTFCFVYRFHRNIVVSLYPV